MGLTAEQIQQYRDEGYLVFPGLISGDAWEKYMEVFRELVERSRSMQSPSEHFSLSPDENGKPIPGRLHKVQGVCVVDSRVLDLTREPEILERVESLIGPNIDVFGTKFFPMLGPRATSTGWHQDNHYFGTNSDRVVSCAIYMEATDRQHGCLQVVPGSHRAGQLASHAPGQGTWAHGSWVEVEEKQAVDLVCPAGTVVLFSANLLHGAHPNLSERSSYRTAWHYIPADLNLEQFPRGIYKDRFILTG